MIRFRRVRQDNERGSLPLALLLSLVCASLSALLLPTLVSQNNTSRFDTARLAALTAAQTGVNVALGQIRAATNGSGAGVASLLPCGPLTGTVSAASSESYSVAITYYNTRPAGLTSAQLSTAQVGCGPNGAVAVPTYAQLSSTGTYTYAGVSTPRTVISTYQVHTTNVNSAGGAIRLAETAGLCLAAAGTEGASVTDGPSGAQVTVQACESNDPRQMFAYTSDLYLVLVSTEASPTGPQCLVDIKSRVETEPCITNTPAPVRSRQWVYNDNDGFTEGSTYNPTDPSDSLCIDLTAAAGSLVVVDNCTGSGTQAFGPDPSVGAGMAGPATGQLVNFGQFGRCLDVTDADVTSRNEVVNPCHQSLPGFPITWNEIWKFTGPSPAADGTTTGRLEIYSGDNPPGTNASNGVGNPNLPYCLTSPGQGDVDPDNVIPPHAITPYSGELGPGVVTVQDCRSGAVNNSWLWTEHLYTANATYGQLYTITDQWGQCLTASQDEVWNYQYGVGGSIEQGKTLAVPTVQTCNPKGDPDQQWNADPYILQGAPLVDTHE